MAERNLDFDKVINRKNTRCLKYDFAVKRGKPADVLPLWVADMDLRPLLILKMRWWHVQKREFSDTVRCRPLILKSWQTG